MDGKMLGKKTLKFYRTLNSYFSNYVKMCKFFLLYPELILFFCNCIFKQTSISLCHYKASYIGTAIWSYKSESSRTRNMSLNVLLFHYGAPPRRTFFGTSISLHELPISLCRANFVIN